MSSIFYIREDIRNNWFKIFKVKYFVIKYLQKYKPEYF